MDLYAYEIKSAKAFTKGFLSDLHYFRKVAGDKVVSTQVIFDGEHDISVAEDGMVNFRNIKFTQ